MSIKVKAIQCLVCKDVVFSRAHHDCRSCSCGAVFIDGGFEYIRVGFNKEAFGPVVFDLAIEKTKEELYKDWNEHNDKYGLIKEKK